MNRSDEPLFDPRIAGWLEDDPHTAPDQALEIVLAAFPSIKQRRAMRVPWRVPDVTPAKLAFAAMAIAVVVGGVIFFGPWSKDNAIGPPSPVASDSPSGSGTPQPITGLPGTLVFRSGGRTDFDAALMRPDRSGFLRLTDEVQDDSAPILSPDGTRVIFERSDLVSGAVDIWTVNADGSGERPLTLTAEYEDWPSWSADGTKAAFARSYDIDGGVVGEIVIREVSAQAQLQSAEADTVVIRRDAPDGTFLDFKPTWSPDGTRIAFTSNMDGEYALYTIRPDGSDLTQVTTIRAEGRPAWSPDSAKIAFQDIHTGGCIWAVGVAGGEATSVTETDCTAGSVAWSPDGSMIAWAGASHPTPIYVVSVDGTNQRLIAEDRAYGDLSWGTLAP
jgi:TolB protein